MRAWIFVVLSVAGACGSTGKIDDQLHGAACVDTSKNNCVEGDTCIDHYTVCGIAKTETCNCIHDSYRGSIWQCGFPIGMDGGLGPGCNDCSKASEGQPCDGPAKCPGPATACGRSTCDCYGSVWQCSEPLCPMEAGTNG